MQEVDPLIKYVLYQDSSSKWRIQAVPVSSSSFQSRLALPEQWRGLRDGVLSEKAGVEGCIFIHASGFIGGANTYEGATFSRAHTPSLVPHSSLSVLTHSFTFPPRPPLVCCTCSCVGAGGQGAGDGVRGGWAGIEETENRCLKCHGVGGE